MPDPLSDEQRSIFAAGYRYAYEQAINDHDALFDLLAEIGGLLVSIGEDPESADLEHAPDIIGERVRAAEGQIRRHRFEDGAAKALQMFEVERACLSASLRPS